MLFPLEKHAWLLLGDVNTAPELTRITSAHQEAVIQLE